MLIIIIGKNGIISFGGIFSQINGIIYNMRLITQLNIIFFKKKHNNEYQLNL